jgi:predicted DCC family thiol-disulfide oxidoreductase YuxK
MKNFSQSISEMTEICERGAGLSAPAFASPADASARISSSSSDPKVRVDSLTAILAKTPFRGWILYDGECRFCIATARQFQPLFAKCGFLFIPLQTLWVQKQLGLAPGAPLEEMRVITADDEDYGGADAVLFLANRIWWLKPASWIGKLPLAHSAVDVAYRWIAARRGCTHLQCAVPRQGGSAAPPGDVRPKAE